MTRLGQLASAAWGVLWRNSGGPRLEVIAPIAEWNLPAGYRYQPETDTLTDAAGVRVTDLAAVWAGVFVPALAARAIERIFDPALGGVVETGRTAYVVPWTYKAQLEAAWGVQDAAGQLWRVAKVTVDLAGAPVTVELERR